MNKKTLWGLVAAVVVILLAMWAWNARTNNSADDMATTTASTTPDVVAGGTTQTTGGTSGVKKPGNLPDGKYSVNAASSTMTWTGSKPRVLGYEDSGTINIKSGTLRVADGHVFEGDFFIDMQSIKVTETSNTKAGADKLENHLLSDDFFAAEKYPNAEFVIKNVTNGVVTGDLTIKATTKTISFPATIVAESDTRLVADASVTLNRSLWDIRYGSGTFFDDLGDSLIADEMKLTFHLIAEK